MAILAATLTAPETVGAAHAAAAVPALTNDVTLTASKTGFLRVRLTREIDLRHMGVYDSPPVFSGAGPVGYALLPDKVGSTDGNVVMVRTPTESGDELVMSPTAGYHQEGARSLKPGIYRLFLLTRGGGSARLRFPGQPTGAQRLTATTRVPWTLGEYRAPLDGEGYAPVSWGPTLDFASNRPGHAFGALWYRSEVTAYAYSGACYYGESSDRSLPLCQGGRNAGAFERIGPGVDKRERLWTGSVFGGPPGKQGYRLCYGNAGRVRNAGALLFFLPEAP
jgi:hypothetical protein